MTTLLYFAKLIVNNFSKSIKSYFVAILLLIIAYLSFNLLKCNSCCISGLKTTIKKQNEIIEVANQMKKKENTIKDNDVNVKNLTFLEKKKVFEKLYS